MMKEKNVAKRVSQDIRGHFHVDVCFVDVFLCRFLLDL